MPGFWGCLAPLGEPNDPTSATRGLRDGVESNFLGPGIPRDWPIFGAVFGAALKRVTKMGQAARRLELGSPIAFGNGI